MSFGRHIVARIGIVAFAAAFSLPMLTSGFSPFCWDAILHTNWSYHFGQQLWNGELYPRWLAGMNEGLGSPVFFYYPPMPYWISSLLRPMVSDDPCGWRRLGISCWLALACSGIGAFAWIKQTFSRHIAFVAAVLFMLMPYHLRTDLYIRGAFAEFWAFAWMPFVLSNVQLVAAGTRWGVSFLGCSYAALIMTHLPTTLIFSPLAAAYVVLLWSQHKSLRRLVDSFVGFAVGVMLASVYLIPAMTMQTHTAMHELRPQQFVEWFFTTSDFVRYNTEEFQSQVLISLVLTLIPAVIGVFIALWQRRSHPRGAPWFWLGVMTVVTTMMFQVSEPVWRWLPILQNIQFPWRFGTVLSLAALPVIAAGVASTMEMTSAVMRILLAAVMHAAILPWLYFAVVAAWPRHFLPQQAASLAEPDTADAPEYRPTSVLTDRSTVIRRFGITPGSAIAELSNGGSVILASHAFRKATFLVDSPTEARLTVRKFFYIGWTATVDGNWTEVEPAIPFGLITVVVPSGHHVVVMRLEKLVAERCGEVISVIGLIIIATTSINALPAKGKGQMPRKSRKLWMM